MSAATGLGQIELISGGDFPNVPEGRFTVHCAAPVNLRLRVRIPAWADYFRRQAEVWGIMLGRNVAFSDSQGVYSQYAELAETEDQVVIDLEKVDYVSSGGLRVLLGTQQEMDDRGGTMKVIHVNPQIMKIFDMVGFLDVLTVE